MLSELEDLAADIAALSMASGRMSSADLIVMRQIVRNLETMLSSLSEKPGMVVGDMAWWTAWKERRQGS